MPQRQTIERSRQARRQGKSASTQAGEFIREEMHEIGKGKRSPQSRKQAIAIGLSEARKAGVKVPAAPKKKSASKSSSARKRSSH